MRENEVICLYLNQYLTSEQFESYFYNNMNQFEVELDEETYLNIISTNFNSKQAVITLQEKLKKDIIQSFPDLYNCMNDAYIEQLIQSEADGEIIEILKMKYSRADMLKINCIDIKTRSELISEIKTALKFPVFCGNNWDAIRDLIYDIVLPKKIVFFDWSLIEKQLPNDSTILKSILSEISEDYCVIIYN